jgi:hypothetical protein
VSTSYGAITTQTLGDADFFGFGTGSLGDPVPVFDFDNRTSTDPEFTDHDLRQSQFGPDSDNDVRWTHDLSTHVAGKVIVSFTLELAIGGLQDGDGVFGPADDRLFIEGIEVPGAFDTVNHGAFGTGLFSFELSPAQIASFQVDGKLDIAIDGAKVSPGFPEAGALESYFIDFARVTVETQDTLFTITQTLGDADFFGFGTGSLGDPVPVIDFDNRTSTDPAFTDHDLRLSIFGPDSDNDIVWTHDLSTQLAGKLILSATLELPIGGLQDGRADLGPADDRLFIEGIEVPGAFDTVDQGPFGTGLFSFELSPAQVASFQVDGKLDIAIDGAKVPRGFVDARALESYFIDFARVTVQVETTIPDVGGSVTGISPQRVVCTNLTTGQQVRIEDGARSWNCEGAGLDVNPGDQIRQTAIGRAN